MTRREEHKPKTTRPVDIDKQPHWGIPNVYDKFDLDFIQVKKDGSVHNGEYNVTNVPDKLYGVPKHAYPP